MLRESMLNIHKDITIHTAFQNDPITLFHQPLTFDRPETFQVISSPRRRAVEASSCITRSLDDGTHSFHSRAGRFPSSAAMHPFFVCIYFNFISHSNCSPFCIYKFISHQLCLSWLSVDSSDSPFFPSVRRRQALYSSPGSHFLNHTYSHTHINVQAKLASPPSDHQNRAVRSHCPAYQHKHSVPCTNRRYCADWR